MKPFIVVISLLMMISCGSELPTTNKENVKSKKQTVVHLQDSFQKILNSNDVKGTVLIYDEEQDAHFTNDLAWAHRGKLPASTFKIANTIIGLETGIIANDSTIFKWDGVERAYKEWNQDLYLNDAFHYSCVPCYQDVARRVGVDKMNAEIRRLNYDKMFVDFKNVDNFWLRGESRITAMAQIDFLKRFKNKKLPIGPRNYYIVKDLMVIKKTNEYTLSGKTGMSNQNDLYNGWFVGYVETKDNTYYFATNIEPNEGLAISKFTAKRKLVTKLAFKELGVLLD